MADKFLIKRPLITEKATSQAGIGKYVFVVAPEATSSEVKKVIEQTYKVNVIKMNVVNTKAKNRRLGVTMGTVPGFKKMIVTLKQGQKLDVLPTA